MRSISAFVPILVSATLFGLLAYVIDLRAAGLQLLTLSPAWLVWAVAAMLANLSLASWRYCVVVGDLEGRQPRFVPVFKINLLSLFLAQLMPAPVLADVARGAASWRLLGLGPATAALSVLHDRLIALAGLVFCMGLTLPLLWGVAAGRQVLVASGA